MPNNAPAAEWSRVDGVGYGLRWRDALVVWTFALGALALLMIGGRFFYHELVRIPATQYVIRHADRLEAGPSEGRDTLHDKSHALYGMVPSAALTDNDLRQWAALYLLEARDHVGGEAPDDAMMAVVRARDLLSRSLSLNPVHPATWAALAETEVLERRDAKRAYEYLTASYAMAPVDPALLVYRFRLAMAVSPMWDQTMMGVLRRDLRGCLSLPLWRRSTRQLRSAVADNPALRRLIEILVRRDDDLQDLWLVHAKRIRS